MPQYNIFFFFKLQAGAIFYWETSISLTPVIYSWTFFPLFWERSEADVEVHIYPGEDLKT